MKRSSTSGGDSLDLLLDTICNTFGGVLFISLLVVILLNMTTPTESVRPPTQASQTELVRQAAELQQQRDRLETLQKARDQQQRSMERFVEPGTQQLVSRKKQLAAAYASLAKERNERTQQISQTQVEINETAQRMQDLSEAIATARRRLNAVEEALADEIAVRTRAAKLPRQRSTTRAPVAFLLRHDRLCAYVTIGPGGGLLPNTHEVEILTDAEGEYVEPKTANGLAIAADGSNAAAIRTKFSGFSKDSHFITIAVWADSFDTFTAVKDVIVADGFEYRLVPLADDEKVRIGPSSDAGMVQ